MLKMEPAYRHLILTQIWRGRIERKKENLHGIMHKITVKDFPTLDLGDKRRDERFVKIIENIVSHPGGSIPQHNERWYDTKATYEFFKNEDIKLEAITAAISAFGASRLEQQQLLVIHDTSTIS